MRSRAPDSFATARSSPMTPTPIDPTHPQALALMAQSEALMTALYPSESNHFEPAENLRPPHAHFVGLWEGERLMAIGGVKRMANDGEYGEIKRVFVDPAYRGRGLSRLIMAALEGHLRERGVGLARLETGIHQPEALGLYRALGYVERKPFGGYAADPLSVFMEKPLA